MSVCLFPAQGLYSQLVRQQDKLEKITDQPATTALSTAAIAPILYLYNKPGASPSGLITAAQINSSKTAADYVTKKLTDDRLGLMWYEPEDSSRMEGNFPDLELNSWGVWIVGATAGAAAKSGNKVRAGKGKYKVSGQARGLRVAM